MNIEDDHMEMVMDMADECFEFLIEEVINDLI